MAVLLEQYDLNLLADVKLIKLFYSPTGVYKDVFVLIDIWY